MYNYDAQLMKFRVAKKRAWPGSVILRLTHVADKGLRHVVFHSLRISLSKLKLKLKAKTCLPKLLEPRKHELLSFTSALIYN